MLTITCRIRATQIVVCFRDTPSFQQFDECVRESIVRRHAERSAQPQRSSKSDVGACVAIPTWPRHLQLLLVVAFIVRLRVVHVVTALRVCCAWRRRDRSRPGRR
jgi:hypothetical protein